MSPNLNPKNPKALVQAAKWLAKNDFRSFVIKVFYTLNPSTPYQHNWHIEYLCWILSRTFPLESGLNPTPNDPLRNVIINVPPRSLKSIICSVALPAFLLGHMPHMRILASSYSNRLSLKLSADTRLITKQPWYKEMFPDFEIGEKDTEAEFVTTKNGSRFATSVGGTITGRGGTYLIADDILNPVEALSELEREKANDWYNTTFYTRRDDKETSVALVIMQRLHELDPTGMLLSKNKELPKDKQWFYVCLPAISQKTEIFQFYKKEYTFTEGTLLHSTRDTEQSLNETQITLGSYAYAAQYLQQPAPKGGGHVKLEWFRRYIPDTLPKTHIRIIQSWDTAIKTSGTSDYSVCTTWMETNTGYYLLDLHRIRFEYPELKRLVVSLAIDYKPNVVLIEDKSSGQQLIQDMRRETKLPIIAITPINDKFSRLAAESATIESGKVYLPKYASWLPIFENEFLQFPNGAHDDCVDSLSQALSYMRASSFNQYRIRTL